MIDVGMEEEMTKWKSGIIAFSLFFVAIFVFPLFSKTTALPDFSISAKDVRVEWVKGEKTSRGLKITATVHCENAGCKDGGNIDVRFLLVNLTDMKLQSPLAGDKNAGLDEGAYSMEVSASADITHFVNHAIKIILDPKNEVKESNEKNNDVIVPLPPVDQKFAREKNRPAGQKCTMVAVNPEWVAVDYAAQGEKEEYAVAQGTILNTHVSYTDWPATHVSHDQNFFVALGPLYTYLYSATNTEKFENKSVMEMEWDTSVFPYKFWPAPRDRVWMKGRWIFDCGHPPYHAEIHPPKFTAFTRTEPVIFKGDKAPVFANKTIMFSGNDGVYYKFDAHEDVAFDVPALKKPSQDAVFHSEVLEKSFGGPDPKLTPVPDVKNPKYVHVVYPLKNQPPDKMFGAVIASGWRVTKIRTGFIQYKITFDSVTFLNDHYSDKQKPAYWRLWADVNGNWTELLGGALKSVQVKNGDTLKINKSVVVTLPEKNGVLSMLTTGFASEMENDLKASIPPTTPVGFIKKQFSAAELLKMSKGVEILSAAYIEDDGENYDFTRGDFKLSVRVEKVKAYAKGSTLK